MSTNRQPAVAGAFYPADPVQLRDDVNRLLAAVTPPPPDSTPPKAIIVPHAGYIYSGSTAAKAYALLRPVANTISKVVLLGPNHRVALRGMALSTAEQFLTPLGAVPIDPDLQATASRLPGVVAMDQAHLQEHSLEVQLPFLQVVLNDFSLLPVVVGETPPEQISGLLQALWGGPETLLVISSDLSHFHPYAEARTLDQATSDAIVHLDGRAISYEHACGRNPVKGLLLSASQRGMTPRQLALCNSGDTAGSKDRVVGYGSYAFY